jgi:hypothetical protein
MRVKETQDREIYLPVKIRVRKTGRDGIKEVPVRIVGCMSKWC